MGKGCRCFLFREVRSTRRFFGFYFSVRGLYVFVLRSTGSGVYGKKKYVFSYYER